MRFLQPQQVTTQHSENWWCFAIRIIKVITRFFHWNANNSSNYIKFQLITFLFFFGDLIYLCLFPIFTAYRQLCPPGCTSCSAINGCITCQPNLFLLLVRSGMRQQGLCVHSCPDGFYGVRRQNYSICYSQYFWAFLWGKLILLNLLIIQNYQNIRWKYMKTKYHKKIIITTPPRAEIQKFRANVI